MNSDNDIPLLLGHRSERLVPQHASVSHQRMDTAKFVQRSLDNSLPFLRRANDSHSLSSSYNFISRPTDNSALPKRTFDNLVNDGIRALLTNIVDDDVGTQSAVHVRIRAP
jgi:hypothetical protein